MPRTKTINAIERERANIEFFYKNNLTRFSVLYLDKYRYIHKKSWFKKAFDFFFQSNESKIKEKTDVAFLLDKSIFLKPDYYLINLIKENNQTLTEEEGAKKLAELFFDKMHNLHYDYRNRKYYDNDDKKYKTHYHFSLNETIIKCLKSSKQYQEKIECDDANFPNEELKKVQFNILLGNYDYGTGCSGSYFIRDVEDKKNNPHIYILKPENEDTLGPENPFVSQRFKRFFVVAAQYILHAVTWILNKLNLTHVHDLNALKTVSSRSHLNERVASIFSDFLKNKYIPELNEEYETILNNNIVPPTKLITCVMPNGKIKAASLQTWMTPPKDKSNHTITTAQEYFKVSDKWDAITGPSSSDNEQEFKNNYAPKTENTPDKRQEKKPKPLQEQEQEQKPKPLQEKKEFPQNLYEIMTITHFILGHSDSKSDNLMFEINKDITNIGLIDNGWSMAASYPLLISMDLKKQYIWRKLPNSQEVFSGESKKIIKYIFDNQSKLTQDVISTFNQFKNICNRTTYAVGLMEERINVLYYLSCKNTSIFNISMTRTENEFKKITDSADYKEFIESETSRNFQEEMKPEKLDQRPSASTDYVDDKELTESEEYKIFCKEIQSKKLDLRLFQEEIKNKPLNKKRSDVIKLNLRLSMALPPTEIVDKILDTEVEKLNKSRSTGSPPTL